MKQQPLTRMEQSDPRNETGFRTDLFPLLDGRCAPAAGARDLVMGRKLQFVFAYYRLNVVAEQLLQARSSGGDENASLRALDQALAARDALDEEMSAFGIVAEPFMRGCVAFDLICCSPCQASARRLQAHISIPLPAGAMFGHPEGTNQ